MPEFLTKDQKDLLKRTLLQKFTDDQKESFIVRCERSKLDPFSGQLHPTVRNVKTRQDGEVVWVPTLVTVTGIYGLIAVAVRTGEYDGCELYWCAPDGKWRDEWLEPEYPAAAKAIVYHKHRTHPEVAIARWDSFVPQSWNKEAKRWEISSDFWQRMPDYMLGKCARAAALRGAFPDQLSAIYISEELQGELGLETGDTDAGKIADAQRREKEVNIPGAQFVDSRGRQPTPEEAAEPAFDEDKIPPRAGATGPAFSEQLKKDFPAEQAKPTPGPSAATTQVEDNLDFGETPQAAPGQPLAASPAAQAPAPEPAWKNHVIKGITNPRFHNRKVGELIETERMSLKTQWLPAIQAKWDQASEAQKADYPMIQACIAYHDSVKPWEAAQS